ncbi:MAG: formylglycine-generating enzyme family protein [Bacillota bacterium]
MIKAKSISLLLLFLLLILGGCSSDDSQPENSTRAVNLAVDKKVIIADGEDKVELITAIENLDEDIINPEVEYYINEEKYEQNDNQFNHNLEDNMFSTTEADTYTIYVEYKDKKSNIIYLEANNDMVLVQEGTFEMGDWQELAKVPKDTYEEYGNIKDYTTEIGELDGKHKDDFTFDALTLHDVKLDSYYIAKHEVTFRDYNEFLQNQGNDLDSEDLDAIRDIILSRKDDQTEEWVEAVEEGDWFEDDMPVVGITWYDAVKYCNWKSERDGLEKVYKISNYSVTMNQRANGYRLPTEAEWEYAARGGQNLSSDINNGHGHIYSGSSEPEEWNDHVWHSGHPDNNNRTISVNELEPNELGLYHMSGNVWEFCWDFYDPYYYDYGETYNPTGPKGPYDSVVAQGDYDFETRSHTKVLRGGSWGNTGAFVRNTFRFFSVAQYFDSENVEQISDIYSSWRTGFRIVRNAN